MCDVSTFLNNYDFCIFARHCYTVSSSVQCIYTILSTFTASEPIFPPNYPRRHSEPTLKITRPRGHRARSNLTGQASGGSSKLHSPPGSHRNMFNPPAGGVYSELEHVTLDFNRYCFNNATNGLFINIANKHRQDSSLKHAPFQCNNV